MANVSFNGNTKLITINHGITSISARDDLYSEWKNWAILSDNLKYAQAFRSVGGDPTVGDNYVGDYYFLTNGWKVKPYEGNHTLIITGNLYVDGGGSPFVPTSGGFNVIISMQVSSLAEKVLVSTSGAEVTRDDITTINNNINGIWTKPLDDFKTGGSTFGKFLYDYINRIYRNILIK
jgi:hypothetical protein